MTKIKIGEIIKIDSRERYGWVDSWTEYLCLEKLPKGFELTIRSNVVLAEAVEYVDENDEELLPEKIDGNSVFGIEGGYILGEELYIRTDVNKASIKFKDVHEKGLISWLQDLKEESSIFTPFELTSDEMFSEIVEATKK